MGLLFCSFPGCRNDTSKGSHGLCGAHWLQSKAGKPLKALRRFKEAEQWLQEHVGHEGDDCLTWPFPLGTKGRGQIKFQGVTQNAARAMCVLRHGEPPTPFHDAAHDCGNGHLGCVNPNHVQWKTKLENQADRIVHGTDGRGEKHPMHKLTNDEVLAIRSMADQPRRWLAEKFGVSYETVIDVVNRRSWRHI